MEKVSLHLDKDWETIETSKEKKYCFEVELTREFNKNHEAVCSLRIESDGRKLSYIPGLECTYSCRSHETWLIEYFPIEEEKVGYELNQFQHMGDEDSKEDQILNHLEQVIKEVFVGELHRKIVIMSSSQCIISHHEEIYSTKLSIDSL